MTLNHAKLADPQQLPNSAGSIYANPAGITTFIRGFVLHNTNTSTETVDLHMVPTSGGSLGSATAANRLARISLAQDETIIFEAPFPLVLTEENDAIFGVTTTASKVTAILLGDTETPGIEPPPSADLLVWFDAAFAYTDAGATTLCSASGTDKCYVFKDQSVNGYDVVQATSGNRPTWYSAAVNSLPALLFGTGSRLLSSTGFSRATSQETFYLVIKPISTTAGARIFDGNVFDKRECQAYDVAGQMNYNLYGGAVIGNDANSDAPYSAYHILTVIFDITGGSGGLLQVNDNTADTGATGTFTALGLDIGMASGGASFELAEMIGYSVTHSAGTRDTVKAYLADKYAITL